MNPLKATLQASLLLLLLTPVQAAEDEDRAQMLLPGTYVSATCTLNSATADASFVGPTAYASAGASGTAAPTTASSSAYTDLTHAEAHARYATTSPTSTSASASAGDSLSAFGMRAWCSISQEPQDLSELPYGFEVTGGDDQTDASASRAEVGCLVGDAVGRITGVLAHDASGVAYVLGQRDGAPFVHTAGLLDAATASSPAPGLVPTGTPVVVEFEEGSCSVRLG